MGNPPTAVSQPTRCVSLPHGKSARRGSSAPPSSPPLNWGELLPLACQGTAVELQPQHIEGYLQGVFDEEDKRLSQGDNLLDQPHPLSDRLEKDRGYEALKNLTNPQGEVDTMSVSSTESSSGSEAGSTDDEDLANLLATPCEVYPRLSINSLSPSLKPGQPSVSVVLTQIDQNPDGVLNMPKRDALGSGNKGAFVTFEYDGGENFPSMMGTPSTSPPKTPEFKPVNPLSQSTEIISNVKCHWATIVLPL